jgi:hypothetical protein
MIRDVHPGPGCRLTTHPGSRGQKGTGSRIRNTEVWDEQIYCVCVCVIFDVFENVRKFYSIPRPKLL